MVLLDSIDSGGGTTAFCSIGSTGGFFATEADTTVTTTHDITVTSWTAQFNAALGAGESVVFALVIDGTPDATLPITVNEAETGGRSADGSLLIPAGSTISIRGVANGAGAASEIVTGFVLGYTAETPFFASHTFPNNATMYVSPAGDGSSSTQGTPSFSTFSNAPAQAVLNPLDALLTMTALTGKLSAATSGTLQPRVGGVDTGTPVSFSSSDSASGAIAVSAGRATSGADVASVSLDVKATSLASTRLRQMIQYTVAGFTDWCVIPAGVTQSGAQLAISALATAESHGFATRSSRRGSAVNSFETLRQLRWPNVPGTFQHLITAIVTGNVTVSYTWTAVLRVNGASFLPAVTGTLGANTADLAINDLDTVHVVADDLVNFGGATSTGDGANQGSFPMYAVGFLAD